MLDADKAKTGKFGQIAFERTSSYEDSEGPGLARKEDCSPYSGNKVPLKLHLEAFGGFYRLRISVLLVFFSCFPTVSVEVA